MAKMGWGSDAIAELVRRLGFKYVALTPGSSFRGLHDSLVNYLGDEDPKMLVCLHEEHCVAIAHGWARVTGEPMLAIVHANVGLMHATMAFYDAWCDRMPAVVLGATGPVDATKRRPWIDWLHTSRDQAALVRPYTKFDDQPGSVQAALESIVRAYQISRTPPHGPTYIVLDVAMQEEELPEPLAMPDLKRFEPPHTPIPAPADVERAVAIMRAAKRPVILIGRTSRDVGEWNDRVALAEALNARVITDLRTGASFPTEHPLHVGRPAARLTKDAASTLGSADAILSLETGDLAGTLKQAEGAIKATIVAASVDRYITNGWSMDHQELPVADLLLAVPSATLVTAMLDRLGRPKASVSANGAAHAKPSSNGAADDGAMGNKSFSHGVEEALAGIPHCYSRLPLGSNNGAEFAFNHPLDYLGSDGGGGVGAGPGLAVGAALALREMKSERMPVAVLGDGDYLMGLTAIWTAVANKIPLLVIISNNRCYYNDIVHQERMARQRERPLERKWIGQSIADPPPDLATLARGQGAVGIGPVGTRAEMKAALAEAIREVQAGKVCVVDVLVAPELDSRGSQAVTGYAGSSR
jgi:thiamine pyrophosphate-dependent acetolactate synthase large subunit-like protein